MTTEDERKCNGCGIMHTFRVTDSWSGDFHCPVHDYCIACHNEQSEAVTDDRCYKCGNKTIYARIVLPLPESKTLYICRTCFGLY